MASTAADSTRQFGEFRRASLTLATLGLSLATFMQVLDLSIANVSLPTIAGELGASLDESTWVITSFTVANAIALPLTGFMSRRFGEVKLFVWATALFSLCSLRCGLSTSLSMLVLCRVLQGAVAGPMYPNAEPDGVDVPAREARDGPCDHQHHHGARADRGAAAGWLNHRSLFVAPDLLHQRADRIVRECNGFPPAWQARRAAPCGTDRLDGPRKPGPWRRRAADPARQGQ